MTGAGAGLFDYDGDGDLDLYFVQGTPWEPGDTPPPSDRLLRNDGVGPEGAPLWKDVSEAAALPAGGYGMSVSVGDVDDDGDFDLFVGNYGPNRLLINRGDGRFDDASIALGETTPRWTTSGVLLDYDGDGRQDLLIVNYVDYPVADPPSCYATNSMPDYCGPSGFEPVADRLLRNRGDGTFEPASGFVDEPGPGLGAAIVELDSPWRWGLLVANDGAPNRLWIYESGGWRDEALLAGVAVNRRGEPEASMGVAVADFDRDGDEDVLLTHLDGETHTLYVQQDGLFDDRTTDSALAVPTLPSTGFGAAWLDVDGDGWLDLAAVNGAVRLELDQVADGVEHPLRQPNQLFLSDAGRFESETSGDWIAGFEVSRGLAVGDLDDDGDLDLVVTNNGGQAELYASEPTDGAGWSGHEFVRPAGQTVEIESPLRQELRRSRTAGSFASASDPRVLLPLEGLDASVVIRDGSRSRRLRPIPPRRYLRWPR